MEYEILDDPQGETDREEARRDGGLSEGRFMLRPRSEEQPDLSASHHRRGESQLG